MLSILLAELWHAVNNALDVAHLSAEGNHFPVPSLIRCFIDKKNEY
jgi:hypothetical protein